MIVDCAIVGGGIAGTQAAVQLGRYRYKVAVIDAADGRSSLCRRYRNMLGYPDGVSGAELLAGGRTQAERLGVAFVRAFATGVSRDGDDGFVLTVEGREPVRAKRLLLATGVKDRLPLNDFPALVPCLGMSVYICPDCDGYEASDRRIVVLGAGDAGAGMALELTHWTRDIVYVNHERAPLSERSRQRLEASGIVRLDEPIREVLTDGDRFRGVVLRDGSVVEGDGAFAAFGGNEVRSELALQLGVALTDNRHIAVDPRTKQTNVRHVWAAGDVTVHSEQASIAMGDGSQAAIWIHKSLRDEV